MMQRLGLRQVRRVSTTQVPAATRKPSGEFGSAFFSKTTEDRRRQGLLFGILFVGTLFVLNDMQRRSFRHYWHDRESEEAELLRKELADKKNEMHALDESEFDVE